MAKSDTENQKVTKMHPLKKGAKVFKNKAIIMVRDSNQNIKFNGKTWKKMRLFETNCTKSERTLEH